MTPFYTILTNYGKTVLAEALAAQQPLEIPHMAVGDGGGAYYEPVEEQTNLRNELWRGDLNDLRTDDNVQGQVIAEAIIPMGIEGDWTVREIGLFDKTGGLIAVGKYPETYIPSALSGAKSQVHISIIINVDNVAAVQLIVDHGQVLASKLFVTKQIELFKDNLKSIDGISVIGSANYQDVRKYQGNELTISVYGVNHIFDGARGLFVRDDTDAVTPDDNGIVLIDAMGRRWKRLISNNNVDVKWFGAKCNEMDDDTLPLQRAIDAAKRLGNFTVTVYRHKTTLPLVIYTKTRLTSKIGGMINKTIVSKLPSPPTPTLSPNGDGSDSYDKDATIIVYHDDGQWATSWGIDNVGISSVEGSDSYENYCIYAPRAHTFKLENVALYKARYGIAGHNWFMFELKKLYSYFSSMRRAVALLPSDAGYQAATTGFITNFWGNGGGGISLINAEDITIISPAFEKMQTGALYIENSQVNIIGIDTERVSALTSTLFITKGSVVNINGWKNYTDGGEITQAHLWVQGGSSVVVTAAKVSNTGDKADYGVVCRENSRVTLIESKIEGKNGHQCISGGEIVMQSGVRRTAQTEHGKSQTPVSGTVLQLEAGGFIDTTLRGELTGVMVFVTNNVWVRAAVKEITQGYIKVHYYNTNDGTENFGKYDVSWIAGLKNFL